MEDYIWKLIVDGTFFTAKSIIGRSFDKLEEHVTNDDKEKFKETLEIILESNNQIKKDLLNLENATYITQNHSGVGDNIGGNKIINNNKNNTQDVKSHSLYQNSLFLDEIKISDEPLLDGDYKDITSLVDNIKSFSNSNYYKNEVLKLLPKNESNELMAAYGSPIVPSIEENQKNRQQIIDNRNKVQNLIYEMITNK